MENLDKITCRYKSMIFHSGDTLFSVARFELYELTEREIIVTGYFNKLEVDNLYNCFGKYTEHPKYGMQFKSEIIEKVLPSDKDSLVRFFSGPLFVGIGMKFATSLLDTLGEDIIDKIKDDNDVLDSVPKMNLKRKKAILDGIYASENNFEKTIAFFNLHGFGIRNIMKIDRVYGEEAISIISKNPYRMVEDIDGIGFKTADKLAKSLGFEDDDKNRIEACLVAVVMEQCMSTGNTYTEYESLQEKLESELGFRVTDFDYILENCIIKGKLVQDEDRIYHHTQDNAEKTIALFTATFPHEKLTSIDKKEFNNHLLLFQEDINIEYDMQQIEAIVSFFENDLTILTGGPGTGKTTVVRGMVSIFRQLLPYHHIVCCAPTGRAAKRLAELTGIECQTVHSLLKWDLESNTFGKNESDPLAIDCLIIDEFSMVDSFLFAALVRASAQIKKIVIIGDEDQLPPVSPGSVLRDIIECDLFPVIRLNRIFRQKEGSDVISLAHSIRNNDLESIEFKGDVAFFECSKFDVKNAVIQIVQSALDKGYSMNDIQLLSCKYNGVAGIDRLNIALQECFNPKSDITRELKVGHKIFRENDKILQLKNQTDDQVYNGDIGELVDIVYSNEDHNRQNRIIVDFDGTISEYSAENYHHITHAYCISVHKSQGSEYPIVVLPIVDEQTFMLNKRLIYTAVSRAKKSLIIVGNKELFYKAIQKEDRYDRKSTLQKRILQAQRK